MQIEIVVVDYLSEPWFEFEGLKFDTLNAIWEFEKFRVIRDGAVIATGRVHEARGEPVFTDYGTGRDVSLRGSALHPEEFKLSDRLVLDLPDGFDLASYLTGSCRFQDAVIASMPVGREMTLDEAQKKIAAELEHARPKTPIQVLRFRRGKH